MTQEEISALVPWTVQRPPVEARIGAAVTDVLSAVLTVATFGSTTGAPLVPTWDLPAEPDQYLGLGLVRARGAAPWLPDGPAARHRLRATRRVAVVDVARRPPVQVPLTELRIAGARSHGVGRRSRRAGARWTLTLTGAGTVEVEGAWLSLAWLGHLAGWPEPTGT